MKQAFRQWSVELTKCLVSMGFYQYKRDYFLFSKIEHGKEIKVLVDVDNLLISGDDETRIQKLKSEHDKQFTLKDFGEISYILRIEVSRNTLEPKEVH